MRKIALLLSILLCFSLCACAQKTDELLDGLKTSTSAAQTSATTEASTAATEENTSTDTDTDSDTEAAEAFSFSPADYLDEAGHFIGVSALEYVTLPDYKGISIPADIHTPSEEDIQEQIDSLLTELAEAEHLTDVTVQDGDTVNIDFVGSIDGVEFEGGNTEGQGTTVTIGVTTYIDDFLEQLIGHKPGETFDIEVTFPEDYGEESLNGKDAVFVTTINYVEGAELIPTLTDELVADNYADYYGWSTIDEMKAGISDSLRESAIADYLQEFLQDNSQIANLPDTILEFQQNSVLDRYNTYATYYSMTLDDMITSMGYESREDFLSDNADNMRSGAEYYLIVQAIAEQEDFSFTADDLAAYFEENYGNADYSTYAEEYGESYLYFVLLNTNVLELLTDNAVLEEASAEATTTATTKAA